VMGIYAAKRCQPENVYMVDSDPLAIELATINANMNGVSAAHVQCSAGFANFHEADFTKILCNPPLFNDHLYSLEVFIDAGDSQVTRGAISPVPSGALAARGRNVLVALVGRNEESVFELPTRLGVALGRVADEQIVLDEVRLV